MASSIRAIYDGYRDVMDNMSDPRVKDWFMMSGPVPTILMCLSYVYFVKVLGPKLMENRKPFELKKVLIYYNIFQVALSTWLFYKSLTLGWWRDYSFRCQPVDYSNTPKAISIAAACWYYYMSKFSEFFDTIFFVLRKKNDHISTLHVIHHGIMPLSVWLGVKFTPGGHSTFFGLINTFVHIIMYSYYLLSALGPKVQPYLWWKKYLTLLQMVQFVAVMIHAFQLIFIECDYPKAFVWWIGLHAVMFFFLFKQFYDEAYKKKQAIAKSKQAKLAQEYAKAQNSSQKQDPSTYPSQYKMTTGYISDNGLRNRVFIDNKSPHED